MTGIVLDSKEDLKVLDEFISKTKNLKRQFAKENEIFEKKGVLGFGDKYEQIAILTEEMSELYRILESNGILNRLSKEKLALIKDEQDSLQKIAKDYQMNVNVAQNIGEMFFDIAKNNLESDTKLESGYDKDASLISGKQILDNMPAVAVNSKV